MYKRQDILRMLRRRVVVASTTIDVADRVCDPHIHNVTRRRSSGIVDMHPEVALPIFDVVSKGIAGNSSRAAQRDAGCA